jgi:FkbM family methyltransferase
VIGTRALAAVLQRQKRVHAARSGPSLTPLMGGRPLSVLLVGARGGPAERWDELGADVELVGLEPDPQEHARLLREARAGRRYLCTAAGSERGRARLHLTREPGCSSFFRPNHSLISQFAPDIARMFELVGSRDVDTAPLDELVAEHALMPDVLCVDVQGAELSVLRGATGLLPRLALLELEVELNPQYVGQPLFGDVDAFVRPRGFELLGLRRTLWRRSSARAPSRSVAGGQLIHADALYVNRALLDGLATASELVRVLVALSAYQQHDFIEALLADHPHAGELDPGERRELSERLVPPVRPLWRRARAALPHLPHHMTLRSLVVALREAPADDWHDPDFF